ncbi:hypothetical protein FBU59_001899, partial [Linderina macrospora]
MQRTLSTVASELPNAVLEKFEHRNQFRARLLRQRNRSSGLTDTDLRRGYNAAHMLVSRDQYARRVVEAKLSVIVPSLMAVFHKDSLGSFHHACMLLEHCLVVSPMKTARMLLFHQNPPSRWWAHSAAVAKGQAPICDLLPYMSEPCVQQLFLKAEFGVWTGRLMISLGLSPNDAVVVTDALNRIGLGSMAGALGGNGNDTASDNPATTQQRSKALQLVRNRFSQLNRGGFMDRMVELIEDPDAQVSESVSEFLSFMINDCSMFLGFNILFKPIYDSERPVRRLAQLIINSPPQRLSPQAKSATRFLQALMTKTSCQYGLRVRDAQGVRDPEMHARGSQLLLQVGQAARTALESFLPGLFATVVGLQASTDLTSQSAFNRRISVESLRLPEYEEADPDIDTDDTEAAMSSSSSDNGESFAAESGPRFRRFSDDDRGTHGVHTSEDESDLRNSAAALLHAAYSESIGSGSISSSLSPSSTLSASPMNIASGTPERPVDSYLGERLDAEDLGLLVALPKPDIHRLNLLKICIEVLRETDDIDETVGWVDLRVWRALTTWFLNHPHNNMLHLSVYQLVSTVTLEAVRLRQTRRRFAADPRGVKMPSEVRKPGPAGGVSKNRPSSSTNGSGPSNNDSANSVPEIQTQSEGSSEVQVARRRARRRRAMAERIRREEATNCDNILTYMIEQNQWIDKLVRRATSPNFDGAYGYISLILNTLRLAVQVDRRKLGTAASTRRTSERVPAASLGKLTPLSSVSEAEESSLDVFSDALQALMAEDVDGFSDDEVPDDSDLLPDLAYHDPSTRRRLSEYPLYRLQRWEISLLYSPSFRAHLRRLRKQAVRMVRKLDTFKLCDQARTPIVSRDNGQRPVPYLSPQRIRPPVSLDNAEIKKKQLQINVGLLLGNSQNSSSVASKLASASGKDKDEDHEKSHSVNDVGIDVDSLFARMLGFTEDMVELPAEQTGDGCKAAADTAAADTATADEAEKVSPGGTKKTAQLAVNGKCSERPGRNSPAKRKKSRPSLSPSMQSAKVSEILEDMTPDAATEAAEAICNALGTTSS